MQNKPQGEDFLTKGNRRRNALQSQQNRSLILGANSTSPYIYFALHLQTKFSALQGFRHRYDFPKKHSRSMTTYLYSDYTI